MIAIYHFPAISKNLLVCYAVIHKKDFKKTKHIYMYFLRVSKKRILRGKIPGILLLKIQGTLSQMMKDG